MQINILKKSIYERAIPKDTIKKRNSRQKKIFTKALLPNT